MHPGTPGKYDGHAVDETAPQDLKDRARQLAAEFVRYFGVSLLALIVDVTVLVVGTEVLGLHYLAAATIGFAAGIFVVYELSIRWVFDHRSIGTRPIELSFFLATGVIGLGLNAGIIFLLTEHAALHYGISKVGAAGVVFTFNYCARKYALFRAPRPASRETSHV